MTNELAIQILKGDVLGTSEQTQDAIKMAIKALSTPEIKETETKSFKMLVELFNDIKDMESQHMEEVTQIDNSLDFKIKAKELAQLTFFKYLIEDKIFTIWKEENKND